MRVNKRKENASCVLERRSTKTEEKIHFLGELKGKVVFSGLEGRKMALTADLSGKNQEGFK